MKKRIVIFEHLAVVRVPFPFTDRVAAKHRPALVLSDTAAFNANAGHYVLAMITSFATPPWPFDCVIEDIHSAGLRVPSKVRLKIFTLDHRLVLGALGRVSAGDAGRITHALRVALKL